MATHKNDAMSRQDVNTGLIITVGVISVILLVVIAVGCEAWFRSEELAEVEKKWADSSNTWLDDIRAGEQAHLVATTKWANNKTDTVAIPIQTAMQVIVKNQGKPVK